MNSSRRFSRKSPNRLKPACLQVIAMTRPGLPASIPAPIPAPLAHHASLSPPRPHAAHSTPQQRARQATARCPTSTKPGTKPPSHRSPCPRTRCPATRSPARPRTALALPRARTASQHARSSAQLHVSRLRHYPTTSSSHRSCSTPHSAMTSTG
jgi:hypothetical protein